jgi:hypothetical protein
MTPNSLATATIARLYLQQGHYDKAQRVIASLLQAAPRHGEALALAKRLDICDQAAITKSRIVNGQIEVTWQVRRARAADGLVLRIDCFDAQAEGAQTFERICEGQSGRVHLPVPTPQGSCVSCLVERGELREGLPQPLAILAVGRVHHW